MCVRGPSFKLNSNPTRLPEYGERKIFEDPTRAREDKSVTNMSPLEAEVAKLIVQTLNIKTDPALIQPEQPLFGEGLGLDSIDALELSLAISQSYGYGIRSDDPETVATFASLRSLCKSIEKNRTK
jgi:acyl carrier protein